MFFVHHKLSFLSLTDVLKIETGITAGFIIGPAKTSPVVFPGLFSLEVFTVFPP